MEIVRSLPVFGRQDQHGHAEIRFHEVRVPAGNLLGTEGDGFMIAQARLGPAGSTTACGRSARRNARCEMLVERAEARVAFGQPLSARAWCSTSSPSPGSRSSRHGCW